MKGEISASMMCANFLDLKKDLADLEKAGIEYLHFDIMDGTFVPNFTLGPGFMDAVRKAVSIPYDIHLMVDKPEDKIDYFDIQKGDFVSIHTETTNHVQRLLAKIKGLGAHPGAALNPATPLCVLDNILDDIDFVLIMTVNPGFAGQKLIPYGIEKIKKLKTYLTAKGHGGIKIQVDGNVSFENAKKMHEAGADIYIAGTSGLFMKDMDIIAAAKRLRSAIGG